MLRIDVLQDSIVQRNRQGMGGPIGAIRRASYLGQYHQNANGIRGQAQALGDTQGGALTQRSRGLPLEGSVASPHILFHFL